MAIPLPQCLEFSELAPVSVCASLVDYHTDVYSPANLDDGYIVISSNDSDSDGEQDNAKKTVFPALSGREVSKGSNESDVVVEGGRDEVVSASIHPGSSASLHLPSQKKVRLLHM